MPKKPDVTSNNEEATAGPLDATTLSQLSLNEEDLRRGLTAEEIRDLGSGAATALSDPIWQEAQKNVLQQIVASWLQSSANETELRESLWLRAQNLVALEQMLMAAVNDAQQVNLAEAEKAEQDLSRYDNFQGFGLEDVPGFDSDSIM